MKLYKIKKSNIDKRGLCASKNIKSGTRIIEYIGKLITKRALKIAKECCDGKFVSILEGGYSTLACQESIDEHTKALLEFN